MESNPEKVCFVWLATLKDFFWAFCTERWIKEQPNLQALSDFESAATEAATFFLQHEKINLALMPSEQKV